MRAKLLVSTFFVAIANFCFSSQIKTKHINPDIPKRELRGVWIATVANIDWPSKPGLPTSELKQEFLFLLDAHQRAGINAVFLQVRPTADAFYGNGNELWSRFLTGKQGTPPSPLYDPLEFAIEEAHKRGMELHAWFNPYRAAFDLSPEHVDQNHITRKHPEWFFNYAGKKLFNPGLPEVQQYIVDVILNVVKNYDIDGVHFDDYFYPYPANGQKIQDESTFKKYGKGFANIEDWRRNNVNMLIQTISDQIHKEKSYIKFGVSPFGIWQNKNQHPEGSETSGLSSYSQLFADARNWIQHGWVDYINPQVYFAFGNKAAAYDKLLTWWNRNSFGKHLYIGHAAYRAADKTLGWRDRNQIPDQIRFLRNYQTIQGSVYFSSRSLVNNLGGLRDSLQYNLYRYKALPPAMNWLDSIAPLAPSNLVFNILQFGGVSLRWEPPQEAIDGDKAYGYVIYRFNEGEEINIGNPENILEIVYDGARNFYTDESVRKGLSYTYIVTAIDRLKNESPPSNHQTFYIN